MAKRNNQQPKPGPPRTGTAAPIVAATAFQDAVHPPAKNPTLLAVSVVLFALWFAFLLVTALSG